MAMGVGGVAGGGHRSQAAGEEVRLTAANWEIGRQRPNE